MTPQMRITPHGIEYRSWRRLGDTRNVIATSADQSLAAMSDPTLGENYGDSRGPGDIVELSAQARGAAAYRRAAGGASPATGSGPDQRPGLPTPTPTPTPTAAEARGFVAGVILGVAAGAAVTLAALLIGGLI